MVLEIQNEAWLPNELRYSTFKAVNSKYSIKYSIVSFVYSDGGKRLKGTVSNAVLRHFFVSLY